MNSNNILYSNVLTFFILLIITASCSTGPEKGGNNGKVYEQAVSDFYVSLAAIETDKASFAFNKMLEVAKAYPQEPAVWANLGVYAMRQGNYEMAAQRLEKARNLAPGHPDILFLSAILENIRRNTAGSVNYLEQATKADTTRPKIIYMLIQQLEQQDFNTHSAKIFSLMDELIDTYPQNMMLRLEMIRLASKAEKTALIEPQIAMLDKKSADWHPESIAQLNKVKASLGGEGNSTLQLALLQNQLKSNPVFNQDVMQLELPANQVGFLITMFIKLPKPTLKTAPVDSTLQFKPSEPALPLSQSHRHYTSVVLSEQLPPLPILIGANELQIDTSATLPFPGSAASTPLALLDLNYDFMNDLVMAGSDGFRVFINQGGIQFDDITSSLGISPHITGQRYRHVWTADLDSEGDLDIILSATDGSFITLMNNGDNTLSERSVFPEVQSIEQFVWADLDADLDPDAALLDENGQLMLLLNERSGKFVPVDNLPVKNPVQAIVQADINADSQFDLLLLSEDNTLRRLYYTAQTASWNVAELGIQYLDTNAATPTSLFVQDIDNNGHLDVLISSPGDSELYLGSNKHNFQRYKKALKGHITQIVDIDGDRRLDLLGISADGIPRQWINSGHKSYRAKSIRTRASGTSGDRRINSFAIGGELEIRSGLLYQKQPITSPIVHFGLGHYEETDMLRIIWPNGSVQAEFAELGIGSTIFNQQLLKGSCPWLFAKADDEFKFITDILWRSPLGLRINAQETAGVIQTRDKVRIPGDKLQPVDGKYQLRVTAELWETHFFDEIKLVAADHPAGTNLFIDERFVFPAPDLSPKLTGPARPVEAVYDTQGNDVSHQARQIDEVYIQSFGRSSFQGVTNPYQLTVHLPDEAPVDSALWLLAHGWVRPTDSSINVALSQGSQKPPRGLKVEVASGRSGWEVLHDNYGFPAGKTKTIMLALNKVFEHPQNRRIRLTTTTEIYWDAIQWAVDHSEAGIKKTVVPAVRMDLAYRGYSTWKKADRFAPLLPEYSPLNSTTPRWQDLAGYYTRFGPVGELLQQTDDRYVIMNAGDELQLDFQALPPPPEGYTRSFMFISDGWVKDGDLNTQYSKTVLPLPAHHKPEYQQPVSRLTDDPVYQKHKDDWIRYHTRYIHPVYFQKAVRQLSSTP